MDSDILVVGAGPAGLGFAHSMSGSGLKITLLERQSLDALEHPGFDGRDIALTHLSIRILERLGIWDRIASDEKHPLLRAKVLNGNSSYSLDIGADGAERDALGYLVSNQVIRRALFEGLEDLADVELVTDAKVTGVERDANTIGVTLADDRTLPASLLVAADSRYSDTRRMLGIAADMHDFGRVCIVCRMQHERAHDGTAYECFHYGRTLAVLPLSSHESSIVVTASSSERERLMGMSLMGMSDKHFASDIEERFGRRYGSMRLTTKRFAYPLVGVHAKRFCGARSALVGDAAVGMHPVTAHGYNLGLSGADILAQEIRSAVARREDVGNFDVLKCYERRHLRNTRPMYHGTNGLVRFFTDDRPPARIARRVALRIANNVPPIKRMVRNKLTERDNRSGVLPPLFRSG